MSKKYEPPKDGLVTQTEPLIRTAIGLIPVVGGAANELFSAVIGPTVRKRQGEWMESVAEGLRALESKHENIVEELKANEGFIDTVLQASQAAMKTGQKDKQDALRNAILNAALPNSPDESEMAMFIHYIDTLTASHLRILKVLSDAYKWFQDYKITAPQFHIAGSLEQVLIVVLPELSSKKDFIEQCIKDLQSRGLASNFTYRVTMSGSGPYEKRTTAYGDKFLRFISDPTK